MDVSDVSGCNFILEDMKRMIVYGIKWVKILRKYDFYDTYRSRTSCSYRLSYEILILTNLVTIWIFLSFK